MVIRVPKPGGAVGRAVPVLVGLLIQALTAYAMLILAGRILGAAQFGGLANLYLLISTVATGLFQPLEQEIARRRGHERETGEVDATLTRRALVFGLALSAVLLAGSFVLYGPSVRLLGGEPQLLAAFAVALPGYAVCFVVRGGLSGARRMKRYGLQLSVEGTFRLLALALLYPLGVHSAAAYGWLFALAPWIAAGASMFGLRRLTPARATVGAALPLVAPLALLLISTLAAQSLIGAGPISAQLFSGGGEAAAVGAFSAALVAVRLPIFLFTAVQPTMLPSLSAHVAAGRRANFRSVLWRVMRVMGVIAVATFLVTTLLGPWGLTVLFGPDFILSRGAFAAMGVSVALFMTAGMLGQAILALGRHRLVTAGWVVGVAGLVLGMALSSSLVGRAILGLLVGAGAATACFAVLLWRSVRRWEAEGASPLVPEAARA